ncbi:MAG: DUF167 domain-containing protein [Rhodospirillaceae bacterium]|jgi:uncharacterized protein|nr:DUF167 domain-containing protein [Rhodospirillaceae bacterium]MBT6138515.1 DUF167 domain-containing protein [Rhodospirillaceae bacterium]
MQPFEPTGDGLRLRVRLTPKASANRIEGVAEDENGVAWLQVRVTAVPEDGRANKALIKLLAKSWHMAKSDIEITAGHTDRRKTIYLRGDVSGLTERIGRALGEKGSKT